MGNRFSKNLGDAARKVLSRRRYRYPRRRMLTALGPELAATTVVRASDSPDVGGPIVDLFADTGDIHKMRHYLPVYETAIPNDVPIRMLEIGVARGGSVKMWRRHLHPESVFVGIDIDPSTKQFDDPAQSVHVRIGSQEDTAFLQTVIDDFGPFDVILDDGSHIASHMVESFRYLFPRGLAAGGRYIVEDICTNYWTGYRDRSMSFTDFIKWVIDAMHAHYLTLDHELKFREGDPDRITNVQVPLATAITEKVEFYDSIAIVHRFSETKTLPNSVYR